MPVRLGMQVAFGVFAGCLCLGISADFFKYAAKPNLPGLGGPARLGNRTYRAWGVQNWTHYYKLKNYLTSEANVCQNLKRTTLEVSENELATGNDCL